MSITNVAAVHLLRCYAKLLCESAAVESDLRQWTKIYINPKSIWYQKSRVIASSYNFTR